MLRAALALTAASAIWLALSVTVVLWPPATVGLAVAAMSLLHGAVPTPRSVMSVIRRHLTASYVWGVVNGAVVALVFALERSAPLAERVSPALNDAAQAVALVWLALQLYAVPLLFVQRDGRMLSAWRSAVLLALAAPVYSLLVLGAAALIVIATRTWPVPLLLIAPGALALLGCAAVSARLRAYGYPAAPPGVRRAVKNGD